MLPDGFRIRILVGSRTGGDLGLVRLGHRPWPWLWLGLRLQWAHWLADRILALASLVGSLVAIVVVTAAVVVRYRGYPLRLGY